MNDGLKTVLLLLVACAAGWGVARVADLDLDNSAHLSLLAVGTTLAWLGLVAAANRKG